MTRVRIIWNQGGAVYTGHRAMRQLQLILGATAITLPTTVVKQPQWKQAMLMESALRQGRHLSRYDQLLIYREPRFINEKKSQYKTTLRTLGVAEAFPRTANRTRRRPTPQLHRRLAGQQKQKRASRTIAILEQDLLRIGDGDF